MSSQKKNVVIVNASPKIGEATVSGALAGMAKDNFTDDVNVSMIDVRKSFSGRQNEKSFGIMCEADALIFIFPLYIFCLPGMLMRFLQDYCRYREQRQESPRSPKVYAAVNCGFPESNINEEAVRVIKSFCKHTGARFRFGILIGGGGMLLGAKDAPFMKKTMAKINEGFSAAAADIASDTPHDNFYIEMNCPRRLYLFFGNMGWKQLAKKNGLKKKGLYAKPYLNES